MYVNAKTVPLETVPGIRGGKWGTEAKWGEFKCYIFDTL
jgi:hypothetical protein